MTRDSRRTPNLVSAFMAVPSPTLASAPTPIPPTAAPGTRSVRAGLLVAGIGLILWGILGIVFLGYIGVLITLIGGGIMFSGTKSYPAARGMAIAGLGLLAVGFVLETTASLIMPALFVTQVSDPASYLNALATGLLLLVVAVIISWIGVLVLPLRLVTGSAKGLAVAGVAVGLVGAILVLVLFYTLVSDLAAAARAGTTPDLNRLVLAALGFLAGVLMGLIGGIVAGVGYILGRSKLVTVGRSPMPQ